VYDDFSNKFSAQEKTSSATFENKKQQKEKGEKTQAPWLFATAPRRVGNSSASGKHVCSCCLGVCVLAVFIIVTWDYEEQCVCLSLLNPVPCFAASYTFSFHLFPFCSTNFCASPLSYKFLLLKNNSFKTLLL